jgi:histidine triad (HIT) family protein
VDHANEPASYLYEDVDAIAILDINPINEGHTLVLPRQHAKLAAELDDRAAVAIWTLARRVGSAIRTSGVRAEGVNFFMADGEAAGQEVFHVHLHVIPRFDGDGFGLIFPPGYRDSQPRSALEKTAAQIRSAFG